MSLLVETRPAEGNKMDKITLETAVSERYPFVALPKLYDRLSRIGVVTVPEAVFMDHAKAALRGRDDQP